MEIAGRLDIDLRQLATPPKRRSSQRQSGRWRAGSHVVDQGLARLAGKQARGLLIGSSEGAQSPPALSVYAGTWVGSPPIRDAKQRADILCVLGGR